MNVFVYWGY